MSEQKRIILWSIPRAMSTAFLRAMMSRDSCQGYMEPWLLSYYMSADRLSDRFNRTDYPDREGATFKERKQMLEAEHKEFEEIFVKDHSYKLKTFFETETVEDVLPQGYVHTFIIRNPIKIVTSRYRGCLKDKSGFAGFRPHEVSYEQHVQMHKYVTQKLKQKSIIVDADDVMENPETTLRLYCQAVGIDYQDSMVQWRPLDREQYKQFEEFAMWWKTAINSTGFLPKSPSDLPEVKDLPEDVQKSIDDNMVLYQQMYENRLKP